MKVYRVEAVEAYMVNCAGCFVDLLIRGAVQPGDVLQCPSCDCQMKVQEITGEYRSDKSGKVLEAEVIQP